MFLELVTSKSDNHPKALDGLRKQNPGLVRLSVEY